MTTRRSHDTADDQPLVSVIVTTKNNHATLQACLRSIARQTYAPTELIVVDNNSSDDTKDIAKRFTKHVYDKGPERSAQRNFAATQATGDYVLIIDSDMVLEETVVGACLQAAQQDDAAAVIIPEESFGEGFWAQCKRLERSFYVGNDHIEAARFFDKTLYKQLGGYNEAMTGGEDWDFTNRVRAAGVTIARVHSYIFHNEGHPHFTRTVRKVYYYAQHAGAYFAENPAQSALTDKSGPLARYKLFFSRPGKLLRNPFVALGMLTLKTAEYAAGGLGYWQARRQIVQPNKENA
jgi:glycosyltransferase involved in cell wall biosynthesis